MKQGLEMGGRALSTYVMALVLALLAGTGISGDWYWLQIAVNVALLAGLGLLLLSEKNAAAMPAGFIDRCNAKIANGSVKLGDERRAVNGAVLKYGAVEINCAFSEMLSAAREQLEDEVNRALFA